MNAFHICKQLWFLWVLIWVGWAFFAKQTQQRERTWTRLLYSGLVALGAFAVFTDNEPWMSGWLHRRVLPATPLLSSIGIVLTLAGLLFSVWARLHLGRNWSGAVTVKVDHELIRTGPYRFVRHPIYSGILLAMVGTVLCQRELRGFLGLVIVYLGLSFKSRLEEGFMTRTFGSTYEQYRQETGGIIPRFI